MLNSALRRDLSHGDVVGEPLDRRVESRRIRIDPGRAAARGARRSQLPFPARLLDVRRSTRCGGNLDTDAVQLLLVLVSAPAQWIIEAPSEGNARSAWTGPTASPACGTAKSEFHEEIDHSGVRSLLVIEGHRTAAPRTARDTGVAGADIDHAIAGLEPPGLGRRRTRRSRLSASALPGRSAGVVPSVHVAGCPRVDGSVSPRQRSDVFGRSAAGGVRSGGRREPVRILGGCSSASQRRQPPEEPAVRADSGARDTQPDGSDAPGYRPDGDHRSPLRAAVAEGLEVIPAAIDPAYRWIVDSA